MVFKVLSKLFQGVPVKASRWIDDVIKIKFVKLGDLSGYLKEQYPQAYLPKISISGHVVTL